MKKLISHLNILTDDSISIQLFKRMFEAIGQRVKTENTAVGSSIIIDLGSLILSINENHALSKIRRTIGSSYFTCLKSFNKFPDPSFHNLEVFEFFFLRGHNRLENPFSNFDGVRENEILNHSFVLKEIVFGSVNDDSLNAIADSIDKKAVGQIHNRVYQLSETSCSTQKPPLCLRFIPSNFFGLVFHVDKIEQIESLLRGNLDDRSIL